MPSLPSRRAILRWGVSPLLLAVILLVGIRAALPVAAAKYINGVLQDLPGYDGRVEDVDLHLWRGAFSLHGVHIDQLDGERREPLFRGPSIDASVSWRALVRGSLVAEVEFLRPEVSIITAARREAVKEEKLRLEDLVDRFRALLPFVIDRFVVTDGQLHFLDYSAEPDIDIYVEQLQLLAVNLTNSEQLAHDLWGTVSASGLAMGSGVTRLEMKFNPSEPRPTYDLAFELKDLTLPAINDYLRYYLAVVARDGTLSLYAESTARDGKFKGYVKPVVKDLDILHLKQEHKSVGEAVKGFLAKLLSKLFENKAREQLATRVEFSGSFENPQVSVWEAVVLFIRNAFVEALKPGLDASVAPQQSEKAERAAEQQDREKRQRRQEAR